MIKSTLLTQLLPGLPLPPYLDIYKFIFLFTFSILGVQFDSYIYSLISDLPIVWRNLPDGRTWRELVNSLPRATISISTQLMMELCLPSHHMLWVFLVWGCLCLMHITITVSLHIQTPCWVQKKKKTQFPWSHLQSLNFTIFLLLLQQESLSLMGEEYHIAVPFMGGHSPIYYFFTNWPVESLCANCFSCRRKCHWWGLRDTPINTHHSKEVLVALSPFRGIIVVASPLDCLTYLATGLWLC